MAWAILDEATSTSSKMLLHSLKFVLELQHLAQTCITHTQNTFTVSSRKFKSGEQAVRALCALQSAPAGKFMGIGMHEK